MRREDNRTGRDLTMLLAGLAAGIIGGRFGPPLLAAAIGYGRTRAGGDPFASLMKDHRELLWLLDQMAAASGESAIRRWRLFVMFKRKLAKHAMAEEDVVYPLVRNDSAQGDERAHLYGEHAEMKMLLYRVETQLRDGEDWTSVVRPLRDLIRRHVDEEEKTIFPELRQELGKSRSPKLAGNIGREEAVVI
jgi:hemerythrin-like domain-containing protein